jgi:hypothetical protein
MARLVDFTRGETAFALEVYSRSQSVAGVLMALAGRLALRASCKAGLPAPFKGACSQS